MMFKSQNSSLLKNQAPVKRHNQRSQNASTSLNQQNVEVRKSQSVTKNDRISSRDASSSPERKINSLFSKISIPKVSLSKISIPKVSISGILPSKSKSESRREQRNSLDKNAYYDNSALAQKSFSNEPTPSRYVTQKTESVRSSILDTSTYLNIPTISSEKIGSGVKQSLSTISDLGSGFAKINLNIFGTIFFALFSGVMSLFLLLSSVFKFISRGLSHLGKTSFLSIYITIFTCLRFMYVVLSRWMKIHGSHAAVSLKTRRVRMVMVVMMMVCMSAGVIARLYALQGIQHSKWDKIAFKQHGAGVQVEGARGLILDRNGLKLAVSVPALSLGVHPKWIKNVDEVSQKLASVLEIPIDQIKQKLKEDKSFTILAKGVSIAKKKDIESLKIFGLELEEEFNRVYPQGDLASTIIGKAGKDGVGLSGVERSLNPSLVAPSLKLVASRDARGKLINSAVWSEEEDNKSILEKLRYDEVSSLHRGEELRKEGANISLTIDSMVQRIVEEEFDKSKETSKAKNVFGLMMDAESGEIIAIGQTTRYNPNENKNISTEALRNVVLQNSFEPGSTFKPIVAAIALDRGLTSKDEMINCENGKYPIGKRIIKDAHPIPTVTFEQVIVRSSNIGMAKLGFRLGKDQLYKTLYDFGFGQKTGLELSGESNGIMRHSNNWAQIDIATHSFGQGVSVTALQMARAYAALANGGILVKPSIIKSKSQSEDSVRLISEKTAAVIKRALNLVTEDEHGTGKNSRISGVPVYGKTGTAQKAKENGRGYDPDKILASFIGFVDGTPIGVNRTLVFYVAVDEPGVTPRWGGTLAAPVFKSVMERTLSYMLSQRTVGQDTQYVSVLKKQKDPVS